MHTATASQLLDRDWFTVKRVAAFLHVIIRTIARHIDRGNSLSLATRFLGTVRISAISIEKMVERIWH
jgi:hypothetical protein